jgi:hypothetical protein
MLGDAVLRWAACAGISFGQTCEFQWTDLSVLMGLFFVADAALSWSLRWRRALQDLPLHGTDPQHVFSYSEYSDDDRIETSDNRTAA